MDEGSGFQLELCMRVSLHVENYSLKLVVSNVYFSPGLITIIVARYFSLGFFKISSFTSLCFFLIQWRSKQNNWRRIIFKSLQKYQIPKHIDIANSGRDNGWEMASELGIKKNGRGVGAANFMEAQASSSNMSYDHVHCDGDWRT